MHSGRWAILAALTFARTIMGFQFQTVAALSAALIAEFGMSYAALGTLVGLYLLPGIAVAIPGGLIAQRFGDKRVVCAGLAAMAVGSAIMASSDNAAVLTAGRILSGCGAVFLNVLVTKMVTDWFQGREIVTALGVLVSSWPLGIAVALLSIPALAAVSSWRSGMWAAAGLSCAALILVALVYSTPPGRAAGAAGRLRIDLIARELALSVLSGAVWALFNMGFILVLTFGPAWAQANGTAATQASALFSTVGWITIFAIPVGAMIAERMQRPMPTMIGCFLLAACVIALLPSLGLSVSLLVLIGAVFGPPAGLIMALPGQAAAPERRALAMGVYFTCYYVGMGIIPAVAGLSRDLSGSAAAPLYVAAGTLLLAGLALVGFRVIQRRHSAAV
jgi:predicted MFS family arabinose efflux permease